MKSDKKNVSLKVLVLASAIVAPQLVSANTETNQVKHVNEFSVEEIGSIEFPSVKCIVENKVDEQ